MTKWKQAEGKDQAVQRPCRRAAPQPTKKKIVRNTKALVERWQEALVMEYICRDN